MGEVTLTLDGGQADTIRRAVARDAEGTAKAIAMNVSSVIEGHFNADKAEFNRERLDYCVEQLHGALSILSRLPWSSEEELDLGLLNDEEAAGLREALTKQED